MSKKTVTHSRPEMISAEPSLEKYPIAGSPQNVQTLTYDVTAESRNTLKFVIPAKAGMTNFKVLSKITSHVFAGKGTFCSDLTYE
ncbi:MAG: hypothetical protein EA399_18135 [Desulfovibrionales bacterium]|nr:MAG: hypothetical protein EA399_18135 [Desulfovibrionales bacterium]